jgi:hypothetical protein
MHTGTVALQSDTVKPSQIVNELVRGTVRPYLRERGFEGTGPKFQRTLGETVQVVEVQRAKFDGMKGLVYLNGIIYLPAINQLLGGPDSKAFPSVLTLRPNIVDANLDEAITVTQTSDPDDITAAAVRGLEALLGRMNETTTTAEAIDYLSRRKLTAYEGVFAWYLHNNQLEKARTFVTGLHDFFGTQPRWKIFAGKLDDVAARISPDTQLRAWLPPVPTVANNG